MTCDVVLIFCFFFGRRELEAHKGTPFCMLVDGNVGWKFMNSYAVLYCYLE